MKNNIIIHLFVKKIKLIRRKLELVIRINRNYRELSFVLFSMYVLQRNSTGSNYSTKDIRSRRSCASSHICRIISFKRRHFVFPYFTLQQRTYAVWKLFAFVFRIARSSGSDGLSAYQRAIGKSQSKKQDIVGEGKWTEPIQTDRCCHRFG